jgi:hypothetical protein
MISASTLFKLAKGGLGPDDLQALLSGLGLEVSMEPDARTEVLDLCQAVTVPGARLVSVRGNLKAGETVHALFVVAQG